MKCQQCTKPSTLQITEIHGENNYEEFHLCDECAQKYLYEATKKKPVETLEAQSPYDKRCEHCGMKFIDFRNTGRLGCPHDYAVFQNEIQPLLESIHSGTRHTGKVPQHNPNPMVREEELTNLRKELQKAIRAEAYEEAAELRDRIRVLERTA